MYTKIINYILLADLWMKSVGICMGTLHILHSKPIQSKKRFHNGGGGHLVDQAAQHLVGAGEEELTKLNPLHKMVFEKLVKKIN